jgi:hypothetical protein
MKSLIVQLSQHSINLSDDSCPNLRLIETKTTLTFALLIVFMGDSADAFNQFSVAFIKLIFGL